MVFAFGDFEVDDDLYELRARGHPVSIQPRTFDVLLYLVRHNGRVVLKEELLEQVWAGAHVTPNALSQTIAGGRAALGDKRAIVTVRGRGYRFTGSVSERRGESSASDFETTLRVSLFGAHGGLVVDCRETSSLTHALGKTSEARTVEVRAHRGRAPLDVWRRVIDALAAPVDGRASLAQSAPTLETADAVLAALDDAAAQEPLVVLIHRIDLADLASILLVVHRLSAPRTNLALVATADLDALRAGGETARLLLRFADGTDSPRRQHSGLSWRRTAAR